MSHFSMRFVQGSPQDGYATVTPFMKAFLRHVYIRASRMSDWSLKKQAFACAAVCDVVTEAAIEAAIELGHFTIGTRAFNFERGVVVVGGVTGVEVQQLTLQRFKLIQTSLPCDTG